MRRLLGWACFDPLCFGKLCFPTEASLADRAANAVFLLPVKEKTIPEASTCSKRWRQGRGVFTWDSPTIFPLPVDEKAILDNTPNKRACDGHFPLPVKGKAIPSHRALRSPTEPFRALRSPMCTPATEPCGVPRKSFSSTGRGKSESQAPHDCLFLDRQGEKGLASARHVPMIAVSSTGRGERESQAHAMFP